MTSMPSKAKSRPQAVQPTAPAAPATEVPAAAEAVPASESAPPGRAEQAESAVGTTIGTTVEVTRSLIPALPDSLSLGQDLIDVNKDLFDALLASSTAVAEGAQEISQSLLALTFSAWQDQLAAGEALAGVRDIGEALDLAASLAKERLEKLLAESTRLGSLSGKVAQDAFSPITGHMDAVIQKYRKAA